MNTFRKTDRPLVSALVTTFNHERFIDAAIQSLIAQTYRPMEIIVVDDGSTDKTLERALTYRDESVQVHSKVNGGPSSAVNYAASLAKGEVLVLQSGDDVSLPGRVDAQVELIHERRVDIVASVPELINEDGRVLLNFAASRFFPDLAGGSCEEIFRELFYKGNFICAPSVSLTRRVWSRVGPFHEGLIQLQDFEYWLRATGQGFGIYREPVPRVRYRVHGSNLTKASNERTRKENLYVLRAAGHLMSDIMLRSVLRIPPTAGDLPKRLALPHLYLRHRLRDVRQIGYDYLLDSMRDEADREIMARHFGFTPRGVFEILKNDL